MEKLTWSTEKRVINSLIPYKKNPRTLTKEQERSLIKSFKTFDLVEIPAIDKDNTIIAGHQRLRVMQMLGRGEEKIDTRVPNRKLTDDEYQRYLITSNAVTGEWNFDELKNFDTEMLTDIGFFDLDVSDLFSKTLATKEDNFNVDKELSSIKKAKTKLGDIIQMGKHKLICGDSTDPFVVKSLFEKEKASMIFSDPVYNIDLSYDKGVGGQKKYGGNVKDNRSDDEYMNLIKKSMQCALSVTSENANIFYWCDESYIWLIQTLYRSFGIRNKRVCLWIKNGHSPTPGVAFNKCYEPCVYGVLGRPYLSNKSDLTEVMNHDSGNGNTLYDNVNIWTSKRLSSNEQEHATMKPPTVYEKAIKRCTKINDIILDSFSGSGSTLIAAQQLQRRVYAVELEPIFCDLTVRRFEKATGRKAVVIKNIYEENRKNHK